MEVFSGADLARADAYEHLEDELPNVRAALQWAFEAEEIGLALELAGTALPAWAMGARFAEGRAWVERALSAPGAPGTTARTRALQAAAHLAQGEGDYRAAGLLCREALALARGQDDPAQLVGCLLGAGYIAAVEGDIEYARRECAEASELAGSIGSAHLGALAARTSAMVESMAGEGARAQALAEAGIATLRDLDVPPQNWVHDQLNLGWYALQQHDFATARAALEEYLAVPAVKSPQWSRAPTATSASWRSTRAMGTRPPRASPGHSSSRGRTRAGRSPKASTASPPSLRSTTTPSVPSVSVPPRTPCSRP
jgi:hypothetical protein